VNIPEEVIEEAQHAYLYARTADADQAYARIIAEWARKEALAEAARPVKAEIERLELVKGTYAQGQRIVLGRILVRLRAEGDNTNE
jgi:hypothetical protein